jgi:serine/threonine protein kinase
MKIDIIDSGQNKFFCEPGNRHSQNISFSFFNIILKTPMEIDTIPIEKEIVAVLRDMSDIALLYCINFSSSGELGRGRYSKVYSGKRVVGCPLKIAAKQMLRVNVNNKRLHTEINALARLSHPNIMKLYNVYFDETSVVLILEYLGGKELFSRIVKGGVYSESNAAKHCLKLAQALEYMHKMHIVHRDLKPENLVLSEASLNSIVKISDFGLCKILTSSSDHSMTTICGTRAYAAPEINFLQDPSKLHVEYTEKVDVWSMGVILFIMLAGYNPFDPYGNANREEISYAIARAEISFPDTVWGNISEEAKNLIRKMIHGNVEKRITMSQVCEHAWIKRLNSLPNFNLVTPAMTESLKRLLELKG